MMATFAMAIALTIGGPCVDCCVGQRSDLSLSCCAAYRSCGGLAMVVAFAFSIVLTIVVAHVLLGV